MSNDPIAETAKAAQEVAKTTSEAIKATKELGVYVANLVKQPVDTIVGILTDKLKFIRWERQLRFLDRVKEKVKQRNLEGKLVPIPPKLALPIIENATLEEDDYLQDLWANLLIEAGNPRSKDSVRAAFIEIIKQLEPIDAKILNESYNLSISKFEKFKTRMKVEFKSSTLLHPFDMSISESEILELTRITHNKYIISLDNLMRLRCLRSTIINEDIEIVDPVHSGANTEYSVTKDCQYDEFRLTPLGCNFVRVCLIPND